MRFDANGDGVLGGTEGNDAASGLDAPTGGRTDVQSGRWSAGTGRPPCSERAPRIKRAM